MAKSQSGDGKSDKGSQQVRVAPDIAEMISWILRVEKTTSAQLLDPMLRAQVLTRYKKHEKVIDKLKAAQAALDAAEEEARRSIQEEEEEGKPKKRKTE